MPTASHAHTTKHAAIKPQPTMPPRVVPAPSVTTWSIHMREIGSTGAGEQASPSTFNGTEAEARAYCSELTVASQQPGRGPAREFIFEKERAG